LSYLQVRGFLATSAVAAHYILRWRVSRIWLRSTSATTSWTHCHTAWAT
jgi:hypothetical protein